MLMLLTKLFYLSSNVLLFLPKRVIGICMQSTSKVSDVSFPVLQLQVAVSKGARFAEGVPVNQAGRPSQR